MAEAYGASEIDLPIIERLQPYIATIGQEVINQLLKVRDPEGGTEMYCVRMEGGVSCQYLADNDFKHVKDAKVFYCTKCYRKEGPRSGSFLNFTEFGVHHLNPSPPREEVRRSLVELAQNMVGRFVRDLELSYPNGSRLKTFKYHDQRDRFELNVPLLATQGQIALGGSYRQGCGFGIVLERVMLAESLRDDSPVVPMNRRQQPVHAPQ